VTDRYDFTYFRTELDDAGILRVTFDRPERRNAITPAMHDEIAPLFTRIAADRAVKVVVLTGAGEKAFCVGADFSGMQENMDSGGYPEGRPDLMHGSAAVVRSQLAIPQPMIASINGDALGLGATMALFCDITLMADSARIGDPHVKAGLVAGDGGTVLWPLMLGLNRGKEYLFTGDLMTSAEAYGFGLVNHVFTGAELAAETTKLAERIAAAPTIAVQYNKRLANADLNDRVNRVLDASLAMEALTFETADHREAVAAFLAKRPAEFGRPQ
jgi:enoyl-CoA hydratase